MGIPIPQARHPFAGCYNGFREMAQSPKGGLYGPPYNRFFGVCATYSETTHLDGTARVFMLNGWTPFFFMALGCRHKRVNHVGLFLTLPAACSKPQTSIPSRIPTHSSESRVEPPGMNPAGVLVDLYIYLEVDEIGSYTLRIWAFKWDGI